MALTATTGFCFASFAGDPGRTRADDWDAFIPGGGGIADGDDKCRNVKGLPEFNRTLLPFTALALIPGLFLSFILPIFELTAGRWRPSNNFRPLG